MKCNRCGIAVNNVKYTIWVSKEGEAHIYLECSNPGCKRAYKKIMPLSKFDEIAKVYYEKNTTKEEI